MMEGIKKRLCICEFYQVSHKGTKRLQMDLKLSEISRMIKALPILQSVCMVVCQALSSLIGKSKQESWGSHHSRLEKPKIRLLSSALIF
jgi:hypothetical protein